jgi:ribosome-associated toxin RatA of RatAB toxin-antitoxin module
MITVTKSREVASSIERIWDMISNMSNEQKYWPAIKEVKVLSRNGNTIEREATITRGPLGNAKSLQRLVLDPKKSIGLTMTKGPMLGTRKITLNALRENKTKIDVIWEFELKGTPGFAQGFVKQNISAATDKALSKLAEETEHSKPSP